MREKKIEELEVAIRAITECVNKLKALTNEGSDYMPVSQIEALMLALEVELADLQSRQ